MISGSNINHLVERLPYDIWLECLSVAMIDDPHGPIPYMAVCASWNEAILNTPTLWTTIFIDGGEDQDARIETFLALSVDRPLDVICVISDKDLLDSLSRVARETSRIRSFRVKNIADETYFKARHLFNGLYKKSALFPSLLWLEADWDRPDALEIFKLLLSCPNLRWIGNKTLSMDQEPLVPQSVEELSFRDVAPVNTYGLLKRVSLRSLHIRYLISTDLESFPNNNEAKIWTKHMESFAAGVGSLLHRLQMAIPVEWISAFTSIVSSFTSLNSLSLQIIWTRIHQTPSDLYPIGGRDLRRLRHFELELGTKGDMRMMTYRDLDDYIRLFAARKALRFLKVCEFTSSYPSATTLHMDLLLSSIANVRALKIRFVPQNPGSPVGKPTFIATSVVLPNLRDLELEPSCLLKVIKAPNLTNLTLRETPPHEHSFLSGAFNLGTLISDITLPSTLFEHITSRCNATTPAEIASLWPSLDRISFTSASSSRMILHLSSLRFIEFGLYDYIDEDRLPLNINGFLWTLLDDPAILPQLTVLRSAYHPSWELLFRVLRQRNSNQIPPLRQLTLPTLPDISILSRLAQLLRGEIEVHTTRNIDMVIERRSRHTRIKPCFFCLRGGLLCCRGPKDNVWDDPDFYEDDDMELLDILHLDTTKVDLSHTDESQEIFKLRLEDPFYLHILFVSMNYAPNTGCEEYKTGPVDITRYSLYGASWDSEV